MEVKKLKYLILITIMPALSIIFIFSYAFIHVQEDIDVHSSKIEALGIIKEVGNIIFDVQKTRGFACLEKPNEKSIKKLQTSRENIVKNLTLLREKLVLIKDDALKNELSEFLYSVEDEFLENMDFKQLTQIIYKFMFFSHRISYSFELPLKSNLNDYLLTNNIIYLLPEIIEHNGQIRAIASNINDSNFTQNQKKTVLTQIDKIEEKLNKLEENLFLLYKSPNHVEIKKNHKKMIEAQNNITNYAKSWLLDNNITVESNEAFELMTKNIEAIIELYNSNLVFLNKSLKENRKYSTYILFGGFMSMLFVIYVNILFYYKNRKYVDKIEELTITDSMSGLYNRRHFDEVFENSLKVQQRTKQTLVLIMLDIDFFKTYNDTYGHQAGDIAITKVTKNLKNALKRAGDMAFRLGGEEFGVLCGGMSESEALDFANKIRENIENEKIEHSESEVSKYVTVSMGIIVVQPNIMNTPNEIYKCADKALYKAKEEGRNRVVVYK
ncbi:MAG: GGDEF domain-containing protein [Sulfurimonas sp.]|uniref:GGDEF domain-containing protein n=1 Tax=Sulfurimonas sp. TaxID=2022749 RepID=UPI0026357592|nr:GGDEF domain-containing protein [Sulfurimonas sp.]MCW8895822.1 GGDEF domain-containing protein [Sulfurimonas sp.]MCW8954892.1 GGDEF domain-containing protein [Sulfurimonas sp.]MCW9067819.1 GGDEF domain-containing protein [Sulfurimonas sp.]